MLSVLPYIYRHGKHTKHRKHRKHLIFFSVSSCASVYAGSTYIVPSVWICRRIRGQAGSVTDGNQRTASLSKEMLLPPADGAAGRIDDYPDDIQRI